MGLGGFGAIEGCEELMGGYSAIGSIGGVWEGAPDAGWGWGRIYEDVVVQMSAGGK